MSTVSNDQLLEISDRLIGIAEYISAIVEHKNDESSSNILESPGAQNTSSDRKRMLFIAEQIYQIESAKSRKFSQYKTVSDPGWNILLHIFISMLKDALPSIKAATATAGCPPVTGLRWVCALEAKGLVERHSDVSDRRRTLLRLTETGYAAMEDAVLRMGEIFARSAKVLR